MTSKQIATQIRNLLRSLVDAEIAVVIQPVAEEKVMGRTRVTWSPPAFLKRALVTSKFATVEEYSSFIEDALYSAILYDGSLLQISYDFVGPDLVGHRLCYYPCPFDIDQELIQSEPIGDVIEYYRASKDVVVNLRSPCRFDYDLANVAVGHAAVHLHVISPNCRWPVTHPITVGDFVRFVFRRFYPNMWAVHEFLREFPLGEPRKRTIAVEEESDLHVSCGRSKIDT